VLTTVPLDGTAAQVRSLLACSGTNVQVLTQKRRCQGIGCKFKGARSSMRAHLSVCLFEPVKETVRGFVKEIRQLRACLELQVLKYLSSIFQHLKVIYFRT
jgi:hypothetical protein